jgi:hypothetical protein
MSNLCAWCNSPKQSGPVCPKCGADYAKAESIKAHGKAIAGADSKSKKTSSPDSPGSREDDDLQLVKDPDLEYRLCMVVIPAFLALWFVVYATGIGKSFQAIVFAMPVHELGHAVSAWFCGYSAVPTVWKTLVPESRGFIAPVLLLGAIGYMAFQSYRHKKLGFLVLCVLLLFLQLIGTFGVEEKTSAMLITFSGDGLGMVLASVLMCTFFFGKSTQLYRGWLRWGFVCIGAAAFVDMFCQWVQALSDVTFVAMGEQEGTHSDPYKLRYYHGIKLDRMIQSYVNLGVFCLFVLAGMYAWGLRQAQVARVNHLRRMAQGVAVKDAAS